MVEHAYNSLLHFSLYIIYAKLSIMKVVADSINAHACIRLWEGMCVADRRTNFNACRSRNGAVTRLLTACHFL